MKVLQVLEATIGGTKRHVLDLASGLLGRGIEVHVACPRVRGENHGDTSFWDDLRDAGVPARRVEMTRRPFTPANARAIVVLTRLMRRGGYDVVHAQSSIAGALARPAALLAGRGGARPKLVYSPHGFAFLSEEWGRRRAMFLATERALGAITDRVIAVSPAEADQTTRYRIVPRRKLAMIPNGVISARLPVERRPIADIAPQFALWTGAPLIGTIARMTPQKDPLTWLQVAARIRSARPEVRFLWIWGGGALEPEVHAETDRLGLRQYVAFLGHRPDARRLMGALDVFLLTSRFEGLPYSAIEALAAETPVVATDVAGTRDVVRDGATGYLAPPGDVDGLAARVLRLLDDRSLARRLGSAGRADVGERFSVERMVEATAALYAGLLAR